MCISTTKALGAGRDLDAARIVGEAADVVDDRCAPAATAASITAALRVSIETMTPSRGQGLHDGHHPPQLLLDRHRRGTRTGRFPADVDDVGTLLRQPQPVRDRPLSDRHAAPPSLKLSGVTLRMPMSRGRSNGSARGVMNAAAIRGCRVGPYAAAAVPAASR